MKIKILSLFILLAVLFSACSLERKLAMNYLKKAHNKGGILIVPPYSIDFIVNKILPPDSTKANDTLNSILQQQSAVLNQVSDSVLMENYLNSLMLNLGKLGYTIYLPSELDSFKIAPKPAYIFRFAQIELSEEYFHYVFSDEIDGFTYEKAFDLNLIKLSSWYEFEARDTVWNKVFFSEQAIMDELSGELRTNYVDGKPALIFKIDSIKPLEIYRMAADIGKLYAAYLNNFLMNTYIEQNFPKGQNPAMKFHYDLDGKMIFPYINDGFQEISLPR
ncbi:MAG: hypothetical protein V1783_07355 [Bacteroidota bacterium]